MAVREVAAADAGRGAAAQGAACLEAPILHDLDSARGAHCLPRSTDATMQAHTQCTIQTSTMKYPLAPGVLGQTSARATRIGYAGGDFFAGLTSTFHPGQHKGDLQVLPRVASRRRVMPPVDETGGAAG
ncbi:hypothetical protein OAO87_03785 [bacterium]|nr:hypothetical protein [bacterium]